MSYVPNVHCVWSDGPAKNVDITTLPACKHILVLQTNQQPDSYREKSPHTIYSLSLMQHGQSWPIDGCCWMVFHNLYYINKNYYYHGNKLLAMSLPIHLRQVKKLMMKKMMMQHHGCVRQWGGGGYQGPSGGPGS